MSLIAYQAKVTLESAASTPVSDEWLMSITINDNEGLSSPYNLQIGDALIFDTGSVEQGTLGFYEIIEITQLDWRTPTVKVLYTTYNNHQGGVPDLTWISGWAGVLSRPSVTAGLLPVPSPDVQGISDRLSTYIQNFNFTTLIEEMNGPNGGTVASVHGSVFITDVVAQDPLETVVEKVYHEDGTSLIECKSPATLVTAHVIALTGHSSFKPSVLVNGLPLTLTPVGDAPLFEGTIDLILTSNGLIKAEHSDGAVWETSVLPDIKPVVVDAFITGAYPGTQSELKEDDVVGIHFESDIPIIGYEIAPNCAFKPNIYIIPEGTVHDIGGILVANYGNNPITKSLVIRVKKANGTWSDWFDSITFGNTDGTHSVILNNTSPTITVDSITYPIGQGALNVNDVAQLANTITNADDYQYSATDGLTVNLPNNYNTIKDIELGAFSHLYRDNGFNVTITAHRTANDSTTSVNALVMIASVVPNLSVQLPTTRLRSGGNSGTAVQEHLIKLVSDQILFESPTLNAPVGIWKETSFTTTDNGKTWVRNLLIHDDDPKGQHSFNSLTAKGLALLEDNSLIASDANYVVGGFVFRKLLVDAYPNRTTSIGSVVSDVTKLRCTNLSKGTTGTFNFNYINSLINTPDSYTITDVNGALDPTGSEWYNLDGANATSNTGGQMYIELEEVV